MKILFILSDLDIGGAQNYTISLINALYQRNIESEVIVLSDNVPLQSRIIPQISLKIIPRNKKFDLKVIKQIANEINSSNYNAIVSTYILYTKIINLYLKRKCKILYPVHITKERNFKEYFFNFLNFHLKRKNEIFITTIENQTKFLVKHYFLRKKFFRCIYNGIDTKKFILPPSDFDRNKFLRKKSINPDHRIILMVAGFRKEKCHKHAIEAFKLILKEHDNVSIIFVGDKRKTECEKLKKFATDKEIINAHFYTADEAGDVLNYYWSADIFTLTSNKVETFPITVLEAMSCGLPCVLTNTGGTANIVKDRFNGLIVEAENISSIKSGYNFLINNYHLFDKVRIRNFIEKKFSLYKAVDEYIKLV